MQFFDYWKISIDELMRMEEKKAMTMYDIAVYKITGKEPPRRWLDEDEAKRKKSKVDITDTHVHHPNLGWITKEKAKEINYA